MGEPAPPGRRIWIAPRVGTQSPWSSKATDILCNTGFDGVERIERARVVRIGFFDEEARVLTPLAAALYDRMTESAFFVGEEELASLFLLRAAKPLRHIDVLNGGIEAIAAADR